MSFLFGSESADGRMIKVVCIRCGHAFPARKDRLNLNSTLPQFYNPCPYCRRATKVRIVPGK